MYLNYNHQKQCLTRPIVPSMVFGGVFAAMDVVVYQHSFSPRTAMAYMGGLYVYNILQCPMEAIHGRQSAWHNVLSGGMLGYIGVSRGFVGVPFLDPYFFYRNPSISPPLAGAVIYGAMGGFLATFGGKPL